MVSQSDAVVKQISAIPWLADSDIALRELGYDDEQVHQLRNDRRRSQAAAGAQRVLESNQVGNEDNQGGDRAVQGPNQEPGE